jgi:hypothetical protein
MINDYMYRAVGISTSSTEEVGRIYPRVTSLMKEGEGGDPSVLEIYISLDKFVHNRQENCQNLPKLGSIFIKFSRKERAFGFLICKFLSQILKKNCVEDFF